MAKYHASSNRRVPFLPERHIEQEAAVLLAEYGQAHGAVTEPPIPIDDIIELYLELTFEFKDMQALFGVGDVHGALWVNERHVGVDASLDPEQHPAKLGRYRFTLAHEAGHWRLHRHLFQERANQLSLLPEDAQRAEYVCRSTDRDPVEIQANKFAAALFDAPGDGQSCVAQVAWPDGADLSARPGIEAAADSYCGGTAARWFEAKQERG